MRFISLLRKVGTALTELADDIEDILVRLDHLESRLRAPNPDPSDGKQADNTPDPPRLRRNGREPAPEKITSDESTWPPRSPEAGADPTIPPREPLNAVDEIDEAIVLAVRQAADQGRVDWGAKRERIAVVRRLYPHQIAGIVARARQLGRLPRP